MTRARGSLLSLAALAAWAVLAAPGALAQDPQQDQKPGQKTGGKLDEAVSAVRHSVDRAGEAVKEELHKAKASINALGVHGRVYSRLHWDKALHDAKIEIHVDKEGTVTLKGNAADLSAKEKAVRLTNDTVGVAHVVDWIAAPSSSSASSGP